MLIQSDKEELDAMKFTDQKETAAMLAVGRLLEVERRINSKTLGRIQGLEVESTGDGIVLHGLTTTYYAKQLAAQIVLEEYADYAIDNGIHVV